MERIQRRQLLSVGLAAVALPFLDYGLLKIRELYEKDQSFSDVAEALAGETVAVEGYMAPPLKANATFFVLTKRPMSVCPFCETEADWPDDILAVYTRRVFRVVPFNRKIAVTGDLSLGTFVDPDTGFLSRVRIENARFDYA